ncbi:MAG: hypothetical protein RDV48_09345 [Candidatus Eremiobacteraeota bacterium]|nr:hypothetical protein [Candidatus Eremiobacteraeota bacterium]
MKKSYFTLGAVIFLVLFMIALFLTEGCNSGSSSSSSPSPSVSGSPNPSPNPTGSPSTGKETTLAQGLTNAFDLALSSDNTYVYWTQTGGSGGVYAAKTDGTTTTPQALATGTSGANAYSICVSSAGYLYYSQFVGTGQGTIMRLKIPTTTGGSWGTAETYVSGLTNPAWVRESNGIIYWTEFVQANGRFRRIQSSYTTQQIPTGGYTTASTEVETINSSQGFNYPYRFILDSTTNNAIIAELAGSGSNIWITGMTKDSTPSKIFTDAQTCRYPTGLAYDNSNNYVYYANYQADTGVYRFKIKQTSGVYETVTTPEATVETGRWRAFYLFGPSAGKVYFSVNETRANAGSIYSEDVSKITDAAVNVLGSNTTATSPLQFVISAGKYYWTEDPDFNTTTATCTGSSNCRVMKYDPTGK